MENTMKNNELALYIALDRSGSMSSRWEQAIETINEYINGLKKEKIEGKVNVIAFDTDSRSNVSLVKMIEDKSIAYFEPINHTGEVQPRGMTPLYDAAASIMDRAVENAAKRTVVAIMTDGHENASKEYTQSNIKDKVEAMTRKGYEVLFLGANFDVTSYTQSAGLATSKMRNVDMSSDLDRKMMYTDLSSSTVAYAATGAAINLETNDKK
jgi:Mg-chelatase subunit ChlD